MEPEGNCQLCGSPLDPGDEDACPSCLLALGFTDEESEPPEAEDAVAVSLRRLPPDIKIVDLIGRGGMGVVYKARQIELDRLVALKILSPQLAEEPEFTVRFAREARLMAKLNHPNIVIVHNFGSSEGLCYLIMECVTGRSLADVIDEGRLPADEALSLGLKICDALRYAHSQGVIHRDIKPENILITEAGEPKVTDFGLAKLVDGHPNALALTLPAQSLGTPYYMAPEQRDNSMGTDARADVYALGVTLYQLLTGQLPTGRFPLPSETAGVPEQWDAIILKALQTDRELRHADAGEFYGEMRALTMSAVSPAPSVHSTVPAASPEPAPAEFPDRPQGKTIFLAFTSSDLEMARERLRRELTGWGHRIVPTVPVLPLNAPQAEAIIRSALMTADISVHPVGSQYGWIPDGSDRSIVEIQDLLASEEARRNRLERVIWIPRGLPPTDDRLRRFLVTAHQNAELSPATEINRDALDRFIQVLQEKLAGPTPSETVPGERPGLDQAPLIYLINEVSDEESADRVEDYLFDLGFEITRPLSAGSANEKEAAHRRHLASCDAALIYWGQAPKSWVDNNLLDLKNSTAFARSPSVPVQGLLIGPPMNRSKQRFRTHFAEVMRFDSEFAEVVLEPFVVQVAALLLKRTH